MTSASQSRRGLRAILALAASATAATLLFGCSGSMIADHLPAGGLPENAPERPAVPQAYPAVHNMPPARSTATLNDDEQKRLQDDLVAVRNRYGNGTAAPSTTGSTANPPAGGARNP
jgi:hypothetical protein